MEVSKDKYYLFRDLDHEPNLLDGLTYHAAGIVDKVYSEVEQPSWKDLSVSFLEPFDCTVTSAWRTYKDVELFEVSEWHWMEIRDFYSKLETVIG
jgi:hypothetical protein